MRLDGKDGAGVRLALRLFWGVGGLLAAGCSVTINSTDGGPQTSDGGGAYAIEAGEDGGSRVDAAASPETGADDAGVSEGGLQSDAALGGDDGEAGPAGSTAWVMGYYYGPDTSVYPVSAVDWAALTHLAVAFYGPNVDGSVDDTLGLDALDGPALAHSLVDAAHAHGVKAIASVGGAQSQGAFQQATASGTMASFVAHLSNLVTTYGYDGLDIDWEPLDPADQPAVVAIAQQVRAAHPGVVMTVPVAYTNPNKMTDLTGYRAIADAYDQVNVMTYGMAGSWSGWKSWHTSALYFTDRQTPSSVDDSITEYLGGGVPAAKLGMGVSSYGKCYGAPVNGPDQTLGNAQTIADVSYSDIMASYFAPGARQWDSNARATYLSFAAPSGPGACTFITYDDAQSIGEKGAYFKAKGLGGVIVWRINRSQPASQPSLLDAVRTAFRSR